MMFTYNEISKDLFKKQVEFQTKVAELESLKAKIEGMKSENKTREIYDDLLTHSEQDFLEVSVSMKKIANDLDDIKNEIDNMA